MSKQVLGSWLVRRACFTSPRHSRQPLGCEDETRAQVLYSAEVSNKGGVGEAQSNHGDYICCGETFQHADDDSI